MIRSDEAPELARDLVLGGASTLVLFILSPMSMLAPIPGLIYARKRGFLFGVFAFMAGVLPLGFFAEFENSMLIVLSALLTYIALALVMQFEFNFPKTVLFAALFSLGFQVLFMIAVGAASPDGIIAFWSSYASDSLDAVLTMTSQMDSQTVSWKREQSSEQMIVFIKRNYGLILSLIPGFAAVMIIVEAWLNFLFVRMLDPFGFAGWIGEDLSRWRLPDKTIWLMIVSLLLAVSGLDVIKAVGMNFLIVFMFVYFIQGLAIAAFYFNKFRIGPLLRALLYFLIVTPSPITLIVGGLGLFDFYFDLRRLDQPELPTPENGDDG
jgi:uncharacterized protein YybS (DUF2232 family)